MSLSGKLANFGQFSRPNIADDGIDDVKSMKTPRRMPRRLGRLPRLERMVPYRTQESDVQRLRWWVFLIDCWQDR